MYITSHDSGNLSDLVDKAICKYKFQPSILFIKNKSDNEKLFSFQPISKFDMEKEIQAITGNIPDNLKLADIIPVFKKKDPLNKENYRSVSVLPSISKSFEKLMQKKKINK